MRRTIWLECLLGIGLVSVITSPSHAQSEWLQFGRNGEHNGYQPNVVGQPLNAIRLVMTNDTEYMAALLTSVAEDKDKSALYLSECRRMGIKVLPPDVNESSATFTPVGNDIRFGMAAVRNVGASVVESIASARRR